MAIHILPPQLANQIAAGEVVERPCSVIKELVENSIDAGADHIDIDIEQGGCKLIRIRDNGRGIIKDDLALALARHATSKIHCLDDLEAIISLGFRGEALASISSISRLTLTSKTAEQSEAWQVYAEGRDMLATIKPAAHPTGTTVEVLDLFYNTPARRRFLKTEKTEFTHIDEMIRRIALAYPKVAFNLQHNGKLIKQYRRAESDTQIEKRLATICGIGFIQQAIKLSWQHDDLSIHGWVAPNVTPDLQYFYVNGRVIKDKLLNHALKQAFIEFSQKQGKTAEQTLSYVIYLDLNPHQVDVNVHPAKHEVRFHEARLVHDFVYQAMVMALRSHENLFDHNKPEHAVLSPDTTNLSNRAAAGTNIYDIPSSYSSPVESSQQVEQKITESTKRLIVSAEKPSHIDINRQSKIYGTLVQAVPVHIVKEEPISSQQQSVIESLFPPRSEPLVATAKNIEVSSAVRFGKVITIIANQYVILEKYENYQQQLGLLSIKQAQIALFSNKILTDGSINNTERLLIPLSLLLNKKEQRLMLQMKAVLTRFHFEFDIVKEKLQLSSVPKLLRQANWQQLLPKLITFLFQEQENIVLEKQLLNWLIEQHCCINEPAILWSIPKAVQLLSELEQMDERDISIDLIIKPIDLSTAIAQFGES